MLLTAPGSRCELAKNLGFAHLVKGTLAARANLQAAERLLSSPLLAECQPAPASFGLGQVYWREGRPAAAAAAMRAGQEREDLRRFLTARIYEQAGRRDDAWGEYRQLPRDAAAYFYLLADQADQRGDYEEALYNLSIATTINPAYPKAYYRAAFAYWRRLGDMDAAAAMIRKGLAVQQGASAERDLYLGLLCYYEEDAACATAAWTSALREKAVLEPAVDPRRLAYEMLTRTDGEQRPRSPGQLAFNAGKVEAQ